MIWEGETVPDYQSGPNVITRVLLRGRQRVRGRVWKMVTLLAWRWKRGPWASRSWKIQGNKGTQPCWHLDFSTVRPHVKLLTQNCNIIVLLFKPLDLWFAYKFKQILNTRDFYENDNQMAMIQVSFFNVTWGKHIMKITVTKSLNLSSIWMKL